MASPDVCLTTEFTEDDDEYGAPYRHLEIYGLYEASNGRSCTHHACCGKLVVAGDILRIKKTVVEIPSGAAEEALALTLTEGGEEKCRMAFIPQFLLNSKLIRNNIEKFVQVVELFGQSESTAKRQKDQQYCGVTGCIFMDNIPSYE